MGQLRKRKNSPYLYYLWSHNGRQMERSTKEIDRRKAFLKGMEFEKELLLGGEERATPTPPPQAAPSPREALLRYVQDLKRQGLSDGYQDDILRHCREFGEDEWPATQKIRDVLTARLERGGSPKTHNLVLTHLKGFLAFCVKERWLAENPAEEVSPSRGRKVHPKRAFTPEEWQRFIPAVLKSRDGKRRALKYRISALSGLRVGELCRIRRSHFVLDPKPYWHLKPEPGMKTKREVSVSMLPQARELLLPFRDLSPAELVFPGELQQVTFMADLERAGIEREVTGRYLTLHSLRYTFATLLHRQGLHITTVQKLMRHSSIQLTVDLYGDLGLEDLDRDVEGVSLDV